MEDSRYPSNACDACHTPMDKKELRESLDCRCRTCAGNTFCRWCHRDLFK